MRICCLLLKLSGRSPVRRMCYQSVSESLDSTTCGERIKVQTPCGLMLLLPC